MDRWNLWMFGLGLLTLGLGAWRLIASPEQGQAPERVPDYTAQEMQAISLRTAELKTTVAAQRDFHEKRDAALRRLVERPDLRRATADVYAAACTCYPRFLASIRRVEPGATDRERVAHSLIKDLEWSIQDKTYPREMAAIVEQLQAEVRSPGFMQWSAEQGTSDSRLPTP
jgi:hypothetical protein